MKNFASRLGLTLIAAALAAGLASCKERAEEPSEDQIRSEFEAEVWKVAEYTVRGEVVAMPTADEAMQIRHEAIPDFKGPDKMGMDVMVMPFPFAEGVSIEGIEVGDKVMLTFSVDYEDGWSPLEHRVIRYKELPADTELDFTPLPKEPGDEG